MTRHPLPRLVVTLIVCFVISAPGVAQAEDRAPRPHTSRQFVNCLKTAKAMRALQHCDSQEVEFQQRALDREFAHLLKLRPHDRARLEAEEAAWAEHKDAKCLVFSRRRGSLNSLKAMDCFRDEIIARRLALRNNPKA